MNFSLKILVLEIIWSHEHTCHIIKTVFQMILQKKFSRNFQNLCFFELDWSSLFFDRSKWEEEKWYFLLKLSGCLDSFPIPLDRSSLFSYCFRFLLDSSWQIGFPIFKTYRNQIWLFQNIFLSISSIPLLIPHLFFFFFFCHFCGQSFKGFLHLY